MERWTEWISFKKRKTSSVTRRMFLRLNPPRRSVITTTQLNFFLPMNWKKTPDTKRRSTARNKEGKWQFLGGEDILNCPLQVHGKVSTVQLRWPFHSVWLWEVNVAVNFCEWRNPQETESNLQRQHACGHLKINVRKKRGRGENRKVWEKRIGFGFLFLIKESSRIWEILPGSLFLESRLVQWFVLKWKWRIP